MSELKPCPFCKCTEIDAGKDYTRSYYRVDCLGCSAFITAPSLELAIQYWNTRPIEDELRAEIARLRAKFDTTDKLLSEATSTIGAVIACCTYNTNEDARIGIYGVDQKAFTRIDQFITHYNDAVSAGKVSVDVKQVKCALAERKEFCPNCEADVPCTHEAELFVCDICGEDFAKYIVSRSANVSDVSMTQDVLTSIKTPSSIENTNPDYYKQELDRLNAERRWIPISEPPKVKGEYICYSKPDIFTCFFGDSWDGGLAFRSVIQPTHWMPLPEPPESEGEK